MSVEPPSGPSVREFVGGQPHSGPVPDLGFIEAEVARLDARLQVLEAKPRETAWYREPAVVISLLALLLSIGSFATQQVKDHFAGMKTRQLEIARALKSVQDTRAEYARTLASNPSALERAKIQENTNNTLFVLASEAEQAVGSTSLSQLTCDELLVLGDLWLDTVRYEKAILYFEAARSSTRCDWLHRGVALRELGRAYYAPSVQNATIANGYFAQALAYFASRTDTLASYQHAYTLEARAGMEWSSGNTVGTRESLLAASKEYEALVRLAPEAKPALDRVLDALSKLPPPQSANLP